MPKTKLRKKIASPQFKDLKPIRIYDFNLIPKYLIEQVKGSTWELPQLFKYANSITASPMTHLYAFADTDNIIKGFFWGDINPLNHSLVIHVLSVDKSYWRGRVLPAVKDFVLLLKKTLGLKGVTWVTTRPKAFARAGFKYSEQTMMKL